MTLQNTFYYGSFEYPKGGGQWYIGLIMCGHDESGLLFAS